MLRPTNRQGVRMFQMLWRDTAHSFWNASGSILFFNNLVIILAENYKWSVLVEQKSELHTIFTLQNRNICIQDTDNLQLFLSIILSLRNQIFNKEWSELSKKSRRLYQSFRSHFWCVKVSWLRWKVVKLNDWKAELQCSELFWNICWQIFQTLRAQTFSCVSFFMVHLVMYHCYVLVFHLLTSMYERTRHWIHTIGEIYSSWDEKLLLFRTIHPLKDYSIYYTILTNTLWLTNVSVTWNFNHYSRVFEPKLLRVIFHYVLVQLVK